MTSDEVNVMRLACVLVFIMALSALVVGSLAYTRSNNPNSIFLGSTSLTDFAATQTVKTRNILGSTLAPAAITTAGTLFNGDVNVNSVSFTGQGLTLYSNTTGLYYLLEGSDTQHELGTTDFTTLTLNGVVTSNGETTTIPNGNITNAMLANAAVANLSGTAGVTTLTGTLTVSGNSTFLNEVKCSFLQISSSFAGIATIVNGISTVSVAGIEAGRDVVIISPFRTVGTAISATTTIAWTGVVNGISFTVQALTNTTGAQDNTVTNIQYYYAVIRSP